MVVTLRDHVRPHRRGLVVALGIILVLALVVAVGISEDIRAINDRNAAGPRCDMAGCNLPSQIGLNTSLSNQSFKEPSVNPEP